MSTVRLADGRRLAFTEYGSPGGFPIIYLHGAIGSPLKRNGELDLATDELGLRLIFVQRPGFGDSDQQPGRTLLLFPADLEQLANALGVERFGVVGVSAGGPYAVACARRLPKRITAAAAVSSLSPLCAPANVPGLPARIAAGLEWAGVEPPYDLVGHSMGGAVALTLAARDPAAVRRLVLVAPAGLRPMPAAAARAFGAFAAAAIPVRRRAAALADFAFGRRLLMTPGTANPAAMPPADVRAMLAASRGATRIAEALSTVASADVRPLLAKLPVHVGAVWGARDRIVPPGGIDTLRAIRPEAPIATVPDAGHILMMERPDQFASALEDVLRRLSLNGNMSSVASA